MMFVPILPVRGEHEILPSPDGRPVSGLKADLALTLVGRGGLEQLFPFRIDTGAACSGMSLRRGQLLGLLDDDDRLVRTTTRTAAGTTTEEVRIGRLIVRLPLLRDRPFEWPVMFYPGWTVGSPALLGLAGVVADLSFAFDGSPNSMSSYGAVTVAVRGPG
jgi:hypothetical protein